MEENKVKISCVIPVYNGAKYIKDAIESVQKQEEPWELLIIDGGSTDGTQDIVKSYNDNRIRLIDGGNVEDPYIREDVGIDNATGDYYHNMGCDDVVLPDAYKVVRESLLGEDWLYGNFVTLNEKYDVTRKLRAQTFNYHHYMQGNILGTPCSFIKLDFIKRNGFKHTGRWKNADYYFLRLCAWKSKPKQIHNSLIGVMARKDSITGQNSRQFSKWKLEMMQELNQLPLPEYAKSEVVNPSVLVAV